MPLQPRIGSNPFSTAQSNNSIQTRETSPSNRANQDSASAQVNQPQMLPSPPRLSQQRRMRGMENFNNGPRNNNFLLPFSPIMRESISEENNNQEHLANSPPRITKRPGFNSASYSSPERPNNTSTPFGTPQKLQADPLPLEASTALRQIGIPDKVISKLEVIISKINGDYGLCGSAALAIHMKSVGSTRNLPVGDLDIVYRGSSNLDSIAQQLQIAINSPNSQSNTAHGQILLVKISMTEQSDFKIDVVPENIKFATEFETINGLKIASLKSLEKSYNLTATGPNGKKSQAAHRKLEIISEIKGLSDSKMAPK